MIGRTPAEFWPRYESWALMRVPIFSTHTVDRPAIARLLWSRRAAVATYIMDPDLQHPANAWLYVCGAPAYSTDTLAASVRRNLRRALSALRVEPVPNDVLLANGFPAFQDTRRRVGLSDGTRDVFVSRFDATRRCQGHSFLGEWHGDALVAFVPIRAVDDWAEIESCLSSTAALSLRPNDLLITTALTEYLRNRRCRLVSYGLSSIQATSNAKGLHEFKTKVGFEARPVHRAFVLHPLLRPCINRVTHRCISGLLALSPRNRLLKRCDGALATMLGSGMASTSA